MHVSACSCIHSHCVCVVVERSAQQKSVMPRPVEMIVPVQTLQYAEVVATIPASGAIITLTTCQWTKVGSVDRTNRSLSARLPHRSTKSKTHNRSALALVSVQCRSTSEQASIACDVCTCSRRRTPQVIEQTTSSSKKTPPRRQSHNPVQPISRTISVDKICDAIAHRLYLQPKKERRNT